MAPPRRPSPRPAVVVDGASAGMSLFLVHSMARGALWSPYYKITVGKTGEDTVVEVNNIFHQSMAPVAHGVFLPVALYGLS